MTTQEKKQELETILAYASMGTNGYFFNRLYRQFRYTSGVKSVGEIAGAYWLIFEIFGFNTTKKGKENDGQVWKLTVNEDESATLKCIGAYDVVLFEKEIQYTDFPLKEINLWFGDNTLSLLAER